MNDTTQHDAFKRIMQDAIAISKTGRYKNAIEVLRQLHSIETTPEQHAQGYHLKGMFWRLCNDPVEANLWFREAHDIAMKCGATELRAKIGLSIARNNIDRALTTAYGPLRSQFLKEAAELIGYATMTLDTSFDREIEEVAYYHRIVTRFGRRRIVNLIMSLRRK